MSIPALPANFNTLRKGIIDTVEKYTGMACILMEPTGQDNPRPALPYFAMKMTVPAAKGGDDSIQFVSGANYNVGGNRKMSASFQCYAVEHEDAYNFMTLLQGVLNLQTTRLMLGTYGIAMLDAGNVADLSELLQTGYEARAQMDVFFGYAVNLVDATGVIDNATVTGTIDTGGGQTTVVTQTVADGS